MGLVKPTKTVSIFHSRSCYKARARAGELSQCRGGGRAEGSEKRKGRMAGWARHSHLS